VVLALAVAAGVVAVVQRQRADRQQRIAVEQQRLAVQQQNLAVQQKQIADQQTVEANNQKTIAQAEKATAVAAAGQAQQAATQAQQAKTASEITNLVAQSVSVRSSQRDLAALLATEAHKLSPNSAASKSALFGTFTFDPGFMGYLHFSGDSYGNAIPGTTTMLTTTYGVTAGPTRILDVVTGKFGVQLDPLIDGSIRYVNRAVSGNGRYGVVWGSLTGTGPSVAAIFDLATGHKAGTTIHMSTEFDNLALDSSGSRLAVESDDSGAADVYDTGTGQLLQHLDGLAGAKTDATSSTNGALAYGPDGRLYVGSRGTVLRVFDPATFAMVGQIPVPEDSTSTDLKFSTDGRWIIASGVSGTMIRIDLDKQTVAWTLNSTDLTSGCSSAFVFSKETDQLWCGDIFGVVHERSVTSGAPTGRTLESQRGFLTYLALITVPAGLMLVASNPNASAMTRWIVDGAGPIQRFTAPGQVIVSDVTDGKLLVGVPNGSTSPQFNLIYTLWDTATGAPVPDFPNFIYADSQGDVVNGALGSYTIGTYNVTTKQKRSLSYDLIHPLVKSSILSHDTTVGVLGYADGHADEIDGAGSKLATMQIPNDTGGNPSSVDGVAISNDDSTIYLLHLNDGVFAFDAKTGRLISQKKDGLVSFMATSTKGVLVVTRVDGTLAICDPRTLAETGSLPGASGAILNARFSDDGNVLVTVGSDDTASVYDMQARVRLGDPIPIHLANAGRNIDVRGDGQEIAITTSSGEKSGVVLWDLNPADWETAACKIAGRNLTKQEWTEYIGDLAPYGPLCTDYPLPNAATP